MEVKGILETVSRVRKEIQERRSQRVSSRSISPIDGFVKNDGIEMKLGKYLKKEIVNGDCEELVGKLVGWRCPLPKPDRKSKSYKLDAVELLFFTLKKPIQRHLSDIKLFVARKKGSSKKPPICRSARTRSDSRGSFTEYSLDHFQKSPRPQATAYILISSLFKLLHTKLHTINRHFFSILKSNFLIPAGLLPLKSLIKRHFFHYFQVFKSQDLTLSSSITTPKFLLPFTPTKSLSKSFQIPIKSRSNTSAYIPGTIIKTNLAKSAEKEAPNSSEEPERNPTFGPDSEDSLCLEDLKAQNSFRSAQIKKSLNELEFHNERHKAELNKSKRSSLASCVPCDSFISIEGKNDSFVSQSAKKIGFKGLISPIRLVHKYNCSEGMSDAIGNEGDEELSLKSFNQISQYLNFDKDSSIRRNSSKDELESFESRLEKVGAGGRIGNSSYSSAKGLGMSYRSNNNNPAALNRKRLLARLEGLSRLEDTLSVRFQDLFIQIIERLLKVSKEVCVEKLKRIPVHVFRIIISNILNVKSKETYTKLIKSLMSSLNFNYLQCKEKAIRKWQMKVRLQIIKQKEIISGIRSLIEVLKKHFFTKKFFVLNLLKYIRKKKQYKNPHLFQNYKRGLNLLSKIFPINEKTSFFHSVPKDQIRKKWVLWKNGNKLKDCTTNLIEICKKKYFPILWTGWKAIKNLDKVTLKLRQKILLKKYIEAWMDYDHWQSNLWIELFYLWKRIHSQVKVNKLKGYKSVFL